MRITLIRHGESDANVAGYINDDPARPVNLTARGEAQARRAAQALSAVAFSAAYASEFPRARQTAAILLAGRDLVLNIDARLNERRSGLDGEPVEAFNGLVRDDPVHACPPGGESFIQQMQRLREFLDMLARQYPQARVLAVSHENPILAVRALTGIPPEQAARGALDNCAWVECAWPVR